MMADLRSEDAPTNWVVEVILHNRAFMIAALLTLAAVVGTTTTVGYPGFQDLGEWLYQAQVLVDILSGGQSAHTQIASYPVPLTLPQLLLAGCVAAAGPIGGGVAFLVLYAVCGAVAVQRLVRRYELADIPVALLLTGSVILGSGFWNGFIGSQWGLVVLMLYVSLKRSQAVSWQAVLGFGIASFFTHGLAFATWGLVALCLAVAEKRLVRFVAAVAPSVALVAWYLASSVEASRGGVSGGGPVQWLMYKAYTVAKLGSYRNLVFRSAGDHDLATAVYWLGVTANLAFALLFASWVVLTLGRKWRQLWATQAPLVVALAGTLVVVAVLPEYLLGIVNPGERVLSGGVVLLVALLAERGSGNPVRKVTVGLTVAGLTMTAISIGLIPAKETLGGPQSLAPADTAGRATTMFTHRVDQFEDKIRAAQEGDLTRPLAWQTSLLVAK